MKCINRRSRETENSDCSLVYRKNKQTISCTITIDLFSLAQWTLLAMAI